MQKKHKGVIYFSTHQEAREVAKTLQGREHLAWGKVTPVVPRIVQYELGYAVQYSRSNAYYPAALLNESINEHFHCKECDCILTGYEVDICCWCDEDREEPDSCGETISYWEGFDYG